MSRNAYLLAALGLSVSGVAVLVGHASWSPRHADSFSALVTLLAPSTARAADVDAAAPSPLVHPAPAEPLPATTTRRGDEKLPTIVNGPQKARPVFPETEPLTIYMPKSDSGSPAAPTDAPQSSREAAGRRRVGARAPELQPVAPRRASAAADEQMHPQASNVESSPKFAAPAENDLRSEPESQEVQFLPRPTAQEPLDATPAETREKHTATPQATPFATHEHADSPRPTVNLPSTATDQDAEPIVQISSADDASGVSLRWVTPSTAALGQETACQLVVRNTSSQPALAVLVEVHLPRSVAAANCDPPPSDEGQTLTWNLGNLPSGAAKTLRMGLTATERGALTPTAAVTCTRAAQAQIEITEPRLELNVSGPQQAVLGQMATFHFRAQNTGTGPATNVVLDVRLADGLQHAQGANPRYRIGTLEPGESRQVQVPVTGATEGQHAIEGLVLQGETPAAKAQGSVEFVRPTLDIAFEGPKLRYVDRKATYVVKVQNPGPAPIENVQLLQYVPEGFRFIEASSGGSFDRSARQVAWFVGRLEPNESAAVGIELVASQSGDHRLSAAAKADEGVVGKAEVVTRVEGVPSVALDVTEDDDPVEVDSETVYRIRVTNHGTRPATHVQVAAEVPQEMQVLKVGGPAVGAVKGQQIVFPPLASLEPGKSEEYQVRVKCDKPGQARFRAFFRSDDTPGAVIEEEHTRVYGDEAVGGRQ